MGLTGGPAALRLTAIMLIGVVLEALIQNWTLPENR